MKTVPDWIFWAVLFVVLGIASVQFLVAWQFLIVYGQNRRSIEDRQTIHANQEETRKALRRLDERSDWLDGVVRKAVAADQKRREEREAAKK